MKIIQPQILTYFLFSILLGFAHAESQDDLCYALSLSGGGAKGSYEVGALWQMARMLDEKEMQYDVVSGISVGGINAGALSLFDKGREKEATQFMKDMWMNLTNADVWAKWDGYEFYQALFNKSSVLDNAPLENFIHGVFD